MLGTLVLGPFAETKGPPLPGRNPATPTIDWTLPLENHVRHVSNVSEFWTTQKQDGSPMKDVGDDKYDKTI